MAERFDLFIVDDDPMIIEIITQLLSSYDLKIKTFTDPILSLEELIKEPPKVLFLDYNMPGLSGQDIIVKISEKHLFQYCSIYLLTGVDFTEMQKISLMTLGFSEIILKPFTEADLAKALSDTFPTLCKKRLTA